MNLDSRNYWYEEWQEAKKDGKTQWAITCKEKYKQIIIESLKKPYNLYIEKLKQYPMFYLN